MGFHPALEAVRVMRLVCLREQQPAGNPAPVLICVACRALTVRPSSHSFPLNVRGDGEVWGGEAPPPVASAPPAAEITRALLCADSPATSGSVCSRDAET